MSIIHDALKKVQDTSQQKPAPTNNPPTPPKTQPEPVVHAGLPLEAPAPELNRVLISIFISVLTVILIAIFVVLFNLAKETTMHPALLQTLPTMSQTPQVPSPIQDDANDPLSTIRVQGVMDKGGKTVALINDSVYEQGQTIFGRAIVEIKLDRIVIMDNSTRRVFRVDSSRK